MSRASNISSSATLTNFSVGAQAAPGQVQLFVADVVPIPTSSFGYKKADSKFRTILQNTRRGFGGAAARINLSNLDVSETAQPHGVDCLIDKSVGPGDLPFLEAEARAYAEDAPQLGRDIETVKLALSAAGAGTSKVWDAAADPIKDINGGIMTVMKAGKSQSVAVLFGALAWDLFSNHSKVVARSGPGLSYLTNPTLFHGNAPYMTCWTIFDAAGEFAAESIDFLLKWEILIFCRSPKPSRWDPSFMKTFRLDHPSQSVQEAESADGRSMVIKNDWAEKVVVTNPAGVLRFNISAS